jgi:hypothetical protein
MSAAEAPRASPHRQAYPALHGSEIQACARGAVLVHDWGYRIRPSTPPPFCEVNCPLSATIVSASSAHLRAARPAHVDPEGPVRPLRSCRVWTTCNVSAHVASPSRNKQELCPIRLCQEVCLCRRPRLRRPCNDKILPWYGIPWNPDGSVGEGSAVVAGCLTDLGPAEMDDYRCVR